MTTDFGKPKRDATTTEPLNLHKQMPASIQIASGHLLYQICHDCNKTTAHTYKRIVLTYGKISRTQLEEQHLDKVKLPKSFDGTLVIPTEVTEIVRPAREEGQEVKTQPKTIRSIDARR